MANLRVTGTSSLIKSLRQGANLNDVKQAVQIHGSALQQNVQHYAPVDTGHLRRNVKLSIEDNGFTAKVTSAASYAMYQEYGTRYQSGTPHVRPGLRQAEGLFISDIQRLLR